MTLQTASSRDSKGRVWLAWVPLLALPSVVTLYRPKLAPWEFMWLLSVTIFLGCKWETWSRAKAADGQIKVGRSLAYLLLWPGMDAPAFLSNERLPVRPRPHAWLAAMVKTLAGAACIWLAVRERTGTNLLIDGWVGMLGLVLFLHFGIFHLIALAWQTMGIDAQPIMRAPLLATSLSDFWGKRWNLGFRQLTHGLVFEPVRRRAGSVAAILAAFLASGIIHDLVISFPARGGYGLPTAYFLTQGTGVLIERSRTGLRLGIGRGVRGRLFTLFVAAGPVFWLFHPLFIRRVMLPFFAWMGSV